VPTKFEITTLFAMRWGVMHWGVDMAAPCGTPYYAAHAGTVVLARMNGGYGNEVQIDHGNGVETIYGHASKLLVREGQHVEPGTLLGLIGTTGYSTGCHLHFEVNVNGEHKDPMRYLLDHGVDIAKRIEEANGGTVIS
jgi:murein DD-endopeptidase MepM/ murein hydrolase activator NlpD